MFFNQPLQIEPLQIEQKCLSTSLEDYLQVNAFPDSVVMEQEK